MHLFLLYRPGAVADFLHRTSRRDHSSVRVCLLGREGDVIGEGLLVVQGCSENRVCLVLVALLVESRLHILGECGDLARILVDLGDVFLAAAQNIVFLVAAAVENPLDHPVGVVGFCELVVYFFGGRAACLQLGVLLLLLNAHCLRLGLHLSGGHDHCPFGLLLPVGEGDVLVERLLVVADLRRALVHLGPVGSVFHLLLGFLGLLCQRSDLLSDLHDVLFIPVDYEVLLTLACGQYALYQPVGVVGFVDDDPHVAQTPVADEAHDNRQEQNDRKSPGYLRA